MEKVGVRELGEWIRRLRWRKSTKCTIESRWEAKGLQLKDFNTRSECLRNFISLIVIPPKESGYAGWERVELGCGQAGWGHFQHRCKTGSIVCSEMGEIHLRRMAGYAQLSGLIPPSRYKILPRKAVYAKLGECSLPGCSECLIRNDKLSTGFTTIS